MSRQWLRRVMGPLAVFVSLVAAAPAAGATYVAGSPGLGDPFFPLAGNGGYDVRHYSLRLEYDRASNTLAGRAVIRARALDDLHRFNLDFRGYDISRLLVNGDPARFERDGQELMVSPRPKLRDGRGFTVAVTYSGHPEAIEDPDGSIEGWVPTDDGAYVVNEPQGSPGWYPANDNPRDKATYEFAITVPEGIAALANGELAGRSTRNGKTTWRWREANPMAPFLATATNGPFELRFGTTPSGLPEYNAVDPDTRGPGNVPNPLLAWERLAKQPAMVQFFTDLVGPYPYDSIGAIVDHAPNVGYALESQTKPNYSRVPSEATLAHEIAHQWFGNEVTLAIWPDIWLNEGFATWSEWIWFERNGGPTAQQTFEEEYARPADDPDLWSPAPAALEGPEQLFHEPVYTRGAMTLQALRQKLGDTTFFRILRAWYAENRNRNVTTADFIALAERESGQQLDAFFNVWLFQEGKPGSW